MEAAEIAKRDTLSCLIIGCGNIAGGFDSTRERCLPPLSHAGAFSKHPGFMLRACVEPDEDRRRRFVAAWGVPASATTVAELNAEPGAYDVISICSPTELHHEHVTEALLLTPRVIFCEKPLALDERSAADIVDRCRARGVTLAVNHTRRWDPFVSGVIGDIRAGRWGAVRSVAGYYNKGLLNNGSHLVDLLLRLLGELEVVAACSPRMDFKAQDPTVAALLAASRGSVSVHLIPSDARDYSFFELEIVCEHGVVRMLSGGSIWQFRRVAPSSQFAGYMTLGEPEVVAGRYDAAMTCAVDDIYHHLCTGAPVNCSGEAALQIQRVCHQIKRKAEAA